MRRSATILLPGLLLLATSCAVSTAEEVTSLAAKPALPYSVLLTGGAFVESDRVHSCFRSIGGQLIPGQRLPRDKVKKKKLLHPNEIFFIWSKEQGARSKE